MRYIFIVPCLILLWSCSNNHAPVKDAATAHYDSLALPTMYTYENLEGVYVGDFGGSDIYISLRHINGRQAMGYSLHKGLKRNFYGTMKPEPAGGFRFVLNEPGNNEYDGTFEFTMDTQQKTLTGTWKPFDPKKTQQKNYTLKQQAYGNAPSLLGDSIGNFSFLHDGKCTYEKYPVDNETVAPVLVTGTWTQKGKILIIDWQPNTVFPNRHLELKIEREPLGDPKDSSFTDYVIFDGRKMMDDNY